MPQVIAVQKNHPTDQFEAPPTVPMFTLSPPLPQAAPPSPPLPSVAPPPPMPEIIPTPPAVDYTAYTTYEGYALMFGYGNGETILAGFKGDVTVNTGSGKVNVIGVGPGDLTVFAGNGVTTVHGTAGNNTFVGGDGVNKFFAGSGTSLFVRGEGSNEVHGGLGFTTMLLGPWDQGIGGRGVEHVVYLPKASMPDAGAVFISRLDFANGDTLDLSMDQNITRDKLSIQGGALVADTSDGPLYMYGNVAAQLIGVGGIDAAINHGYLAVNDYYGGGKG